MKAIKTPVLPGEVLEFTIGKTVVRGDVFCVTAYDDGSVCIDVPNDSVFTKNCGKCSVAKPCKSCEFYDEDNDCNLALCAGEIDTEEISPLDIGEKYKVVRKSWKPN